MKTIKKRDHYSYQIETWSRTPFTINCKHITYISSSKRGCSLQIDQQPRGALMCNPGKENNKFDHLYHLLRTWKVYNTDEIAYTYAEVKNYRIISKWRQLWKPLTHDACFLILHHLRFDFVPLENRFYFLPLFQKDVYSVQKVLFVIMLNNVPISVLIKYINIYFFS